MFIIFLEIEVQLFDPRGRFAPTVPQTPPSVSPLSGSGHGQSLPFPHGFAETIDGLPPPLLVTIIVIPGREVTLSFLLDARATVQVEVPRFEPDDARMVFRFEFVHGLLNMPVLPGIPNLRNEFWD